MYCLVQAVELQVDVHGVAGGCGWRAGRRPVGGQPDAAGVERPGRRRRTEELFVDGRFATGASPLRVHLGGNERVEHPFTLRRGDGGVAVGLVARVGETDRAVQVAVC